MTVRHAPQQLHEGSKRRSTKFTANRDGNGRVNISATDSVVDGQQNGPSC